MPMAIQISVDPMNQPLYLITFILDNKCFLIIFILYRFISFGVVFELVHVFIMAYATNKT